MNPFRELNYLNKKFNQGKDLGFDEIYMDAQAEGSEVLDDERIILNYRFLGLCLVLAFLVISSRIVFLQIVKGSEYRSLAEGNKSRTTFILAPRGLVLDKFGAVIVGNIPSFELVGVPSQMPKDPAELNRVLNELSMVLGKNKADLEQIIGKMDKQSGFAQTVMENIPKDQALILISQTGKFPGFATQDNAIREYMDPLVFTHLTGYTGKITREELDARKDKKYLLNDYIGKTGLESYYEDYLRGIPGKRQTEIDASGKVRDDLPKILPINGNDLKTTIDYQLQKKLYESLNSIMSRGRAKKAAAIATNPQTGEVLALVSLPSFDSNWFARGVTADEYKSLINDASHPLVNRVLSGTYPPGSTVKPMLAIAALTEGLITTKTKILDDGVIRIGNFTFYGYNRSGLGLMDVYSAIARSSDIFFYTIGGGSPKSDVKGLGVAKLAEWYRKFHLGQRLGIDMPSEKEGLVPDEEWKQKIKKEPWYLGDTYHVAIGQGDLLVTPLQVNSWTATIANSGKIMRPYILSQVIDPSGKVLTETKSEILSENILNPEWVKVAQDGMRQTVTAGSARSLNTLPIEISGKTGTAQFDARNLNLTHAWFTSYAPSNDPKIALTILVESGGEGSSVAVPIAKQVYEWYAANRMNQ